MSFQYIQPNTMAKISRNDPCPCHSGKKYKKCCGNLPVSRSELMPSWVIDDDDELTQLTNSVIDLINEKRFDEAAVACVRLRTEFPEQIDWLDRSAMLHEAKGEFDIACDFYRKALAFTLTPDQRDGFDEAMREDYRATIAKLDGQDLKTKTA